MTTLLPIPSIPEPIKKPKCLDLDDFSDDEQYYKYQKKRVTYRAWRFSLLCSSNVI